MQAGFIGDMSAWKRTGLVDVGDGRGIGSGQRRVRAAKGQGGKPPKGPEARWPESQESLLF